MAQILDIRNVCDVCLEVHDKETPGDTYTVNVQIHGEPDSPKPFEVELCGEHGAELATAVLALVQYGRAAGKQTPKRSGPAPIRADQAPGPATCTDCGHVSPTISALRGHVRSQHGKSLADIGFYPANFTCETCGGGFPNRQGLAAHTRAAHVEKAS